MRQILLSTALIFLLLAGVAGAAGNGPGSFSANTPGLQGELNNAISETPSGGDESTPAGNNSGDGALPLMTSRLRSRLHPEGTRVLLRGMIVVTRASSSDDKSTEVETPSGGDESTPAGNDSGDESLFL